MNKPHNAVVAKDVARDFENEFIKALIVAVNCGALTGEENFVNVARAVLKITAENVRLYPVEKEIYNNLKHFI